MTMPLEKISTKDAPEAIGPYSQAIIVESGHPLIFVSGQLPIDPISGEMVQGDIKVLTKRVLDNIEAILRARGSDLHHVVRTDVFLKNLTRDFALMNEEYATRFCPKNPPARQTIQASELPKGALIEISCIAVASK